MKRKEMIKLIREEMNLVGLTYMKVYSEKRKKESKRTFDGYRIKFYCISNSLEHTSVNIRAINEKIKREGIKLILVTTRRPLRTVKSVCVEKTE